ncbi:hypothetical protein ABG067_006106 [Albugo candida]
MSLDRSHFGKIKHRSMFGPVVVLLHKQSSSFSKQRSTQDMQYQYLKAYGLAVFGVFHAWSPFVVGQYAKMVRTLSDGKSKYFGLKVKFDPPLSAEPDGVIPELENPGDNSYTMELVFEDDSSAVTTAIGNGYHTTWKYQAVDLAQGLKTTVCSLYRSLASVLTHVGLDPHIFSFIWKNDDPYLYLGDISQKNTHVYFGNIFHGNPGPSVQISMKNSIVVATVEFQNVLYSHQIVKFVIGNVATQVPRKVYENAGKITSSLPSSMRKPPIIRWIKI